ncbi:MAG TPA: hypothetical protein VM260_13595, partial [Pirellula sp.]|nr:hypothetical protein [Pirellula sp.]
MNRLFTALSVSLAIGFLTSMVFGQNATDIVVPGTGVQLMQVGDDFEDTSWEFIPNNPKSS